MIRPSPTQKQKIVLDYIGDFIKENGYSPTLQNIAEYMGVNSLSTVSGHVSHLVKKGWIKRGKWKNNSIQLIQEMSDAELLEDLEELLLSVTVPKENEELLVKVFNEIVKRKGTQ